MAVLSTVAASYVPPSTITTVLREDLYDLVTNIDPYETSLISMLPRRESRSTIHQWIVDSLPGLVLNSTGGSIDVDGINIAGLSEGFDSPNFNTSYPYTGQPERLTNFTQIFGAKVGISDTLKNTSPAGIRNPYNWEVLKASKVTGKAIERRMFDNASANASFVAGSASDPRRFKALAEWTTGSYPLNQVTAGGLLTATHVDAGMEAAYTVGGAPEYLFVSVGSKIDLANNLRTFQGAAQSIINQSNIAAAEKRIIKSVDVYEGDYGPLAIVMNRQIPQSSATSGGGKAWLLEKNKLAMAQFSPIVHIPLAKTGYNTKGILAGELTYEFLNPKSATMINNVTT